MDIQLNQLSGLTIVPCSRRCCGSSEISSLQLHLPRSVVPEMSVDAKFVKRLIIVKGLPVMSKSFPALNTKLRLMSGCVGYSNGKCTATWVISRLSKEYINVTFRLGHTNHQNVGLGIWYVPALCSDIAYMCVHVLYAIALAQA